MMNLNLSGSLNIFKLLFRPALCLPHHTVATFNDLPIPFEKAFEGQNRKCDIRAVVLDKDDCFAVPHTNEVHKPYKVNKKISYTDVYRRLINKRSGLSS